MIQSPFLVWKEENGNHVSERRHVLGRRQRRDILEKKVRIPATFSINRGRLELQSKIARRRDPPASPTVQSK